MLFSLSSFFDPAPPPSLTFFTPLYSPARLPGAGPPSSNLGYEALTGALDEFGPADYLGPAGFAGSGAGCVGSGEAEVGGPGPHALAEAALGLGTAPVRRAGV